MEPLGRCVGSGEQGATARESLWSRRGEGGSVTGAPERWQPQIPIAMLYLTVGIQL